jgi:hypothetical protein
MLPVLSPHDVLVKGFDACNGLPDNFAGPWTERRTSEFKSHYGSSPVVLANMWYDMTTTEIDLGMEHEDVSDKRRIGKNPTTKASLSLSSGLSLHFDQHGRKRHRLWS